MRPSIRVLRKPSSMEDFSNREEEFRPADQLEELKSVPPEELLNGLKEQVIKEQVIAVEPTLEQVSTEQAPAAQPEDTDANGYEDIQRRNKQLELIIDISRQFSATLDFNHLMDTIFTRVLEVTQAAAGSFWIPDLNTNENICTIAEGPAKDEVQGLHLKQGDGIVGWVIENRLNTTIFDASRDPRFSGQVDEKTKFITKSMLCVPMLVHNDCVGAIQVINKRTESGQFNENDLDVLENLAISAAVAIKNARLFQSEQKIKELNTLLKISEELTATLDLDRVLLSIVNLGSQAIDYQRAVIALLDKDEQVYIAAETDEIQPDLKADENVKLKEIMEHVISSGTPLNVSNHEAGKSHNGVPDFVIEYMDTFELQSLLVIILSDSEGKLGLLSMEGVKPTLIPQESESIINTLANQSSIAIRNAQLYQNISSTGIVDRFKGGFKLTQKVRQRIKIGAIALAGALIIALAIPLPSNISAMVEIIPQHKTQVTAFSAGVVQSVHFEEGDPVKKGQVLIQLDTSLLYLEKTKLKNDLLIQQSALRQLEREGTPAEIYMKQLEVEKLGNELEVAEQKLNFATIRAHRSGIMLTPKPNELIDKMITQGEVVAEIAVDNKKSGHIFIEESNILSVKKGNKVSIALQSLPGKVVKGTLVEVSHAKIEDEEGNKSYIGYYESSQLNKIESVRLGMTGSAKIQTGWKTLYQSSLKKLLARMVTRVKLLFAH